MIQSKTHSPAAEEMLLGEIAEEYFDQLARGEKPDVEEYANQHAEFAEQIRDIFPALELIKHSTDSTPQNVGLEIDPSELNRLGDYQILGELGRGGMGVVYEAHQISLNRRVALKVLPFAAVMDSKQLARFKTEAQAAASLDHPNIVDVYAVGCERSVHFYAMRYIQGQSAQELISELRQLTGVERCEDDGGSPAVSQLARDLSQGRVEVSDIDRSQDANRTVDFGRHLPPAVSPSAETKPELQAAISTQHSASKNGDFFRTVASLGVQAAGALDHAHVHGILHRDIKPGNLMVDAEGKLWVTDFGLARIEADVGMTMTGDILGTLRYMSPEQALAKRVVVDHRADIYSLGVTLYELLSLQPAYAADDRQELLKQIAFEEPRRLRQIIRQIPVELETIVGKAIEKNPADRYETAQELADDLQRFLANEPIHAKPPTLVDMAAKWSRRHVAAVWSALFLLCVVSIGSAVAASLVWRANTRTQAALSESQDHLVAAEQSAAESEAVVDFLVNDMLLLARPEKTLGREMTIREVVANAEKKVATAFEDAPLIEARLRHVLGMTYSSLGEYDVAERHFAQALNLREALLGRDHPKAIGTMMLLARARGDLGERADYYKLTKEALERSRRNLGPEHRTTLAAMHNLSIVLMENNKLDEARTLSEKALELRRCTLGPDHLETLSSMQTLANILCSQGKLDEGSQLAQEVLDTYRRVLGPEHPTTLSQMFNVAQNFQAQGEIDEASKLYEETLQLERRILGTEHPNTLQSISKLANVYAIQRKFNEAQTLQKEALEGLRRLLGREHPLTLSAQHDLGLLYYHQGKYDEARPQLESTLELQRRVLGPEDPNILHTMTNLGNALRGLGRLDEACQLQEETLELRRRILGPEHFQTAVSISNLAIVYAEQGKLDESESLFREALVISRRANGREHQASRASLNNLTEVLCEQFRLDEARELAEEALELNRRVAGPEDLLTISSMNNLSNIRCKQGEHDEAYKLADDALELSRRVLGAENDYTIQSMRTMATVLWKQGELDKARELAEETLEQRRRISGPNHHETLDAMTTLGDVLGSQGEREEAWKLYEVAGTARYRAGHWRKAAEAYHGVLELGVEPVAEAAAQCYLAMAHWRLGEKEKAQRFYDAVVQRSAGQTEGDELARLRDEAAELLSEEAVE